jgi:hypothetical protein
MLKRWLRWLWENEDGFFGIGQGPSPQEQQQYGELGSLANFATSEGESDVMSSDKFLQAILSGDPGQISKVLGPEESSINRQAQQAKKTASEFGTRSGGTTSAMNLLDSSTRGSIDDLIAKFTGTAASALGASGSSLLASGVTAHEGAFSEANTIQQQHAAQMNDLFKSIASVAAAPFTDGASLGGLTGTSGPTSFQLPGSGGGGGGGNWWDNFDWPSSDSSGGGGLVSGGAGGDFGDY